MILRFLLLLLPLTIPVAACDGEGDDDDSPAPMDVTVEFGEIIGTVVTIRWTTAEPTEGDLVYGLEGGAQRFLFLSSATAHEVQLRGLLPSTTYTYQVTARVDSEVVAEQGGTFETGELPAALQQVGITVTEAGAGPSTDGYFFTPLVTEEEFPAVLDRQGNIVWWYADQVIPRPRILAVKPSCDGQYVWYNSVNVTGDGIDMAWMVRVSWDGTEVEYFELLDHNHTFVEIPGGTVGLLVHDYRVYEEEAIRGDAIAELQPDGSLTEIWSVWDQWEYNGEAYTPGTGWSHANALNYDPEQAAYYVSLRNFSCIVKVDRDPGETAWILGGDDSDFTIDGGGFAEQHEFELLGDSMLMFDNGSTSRYASRAVEYALDTDAWTATEQWSYATNPPIFVTAGGDVTRFDSGNTLVTWSTSGQIDEVTPEGEVVWRLNTDLGVGIFYVVWQEDLYTPDMVSCGP